MSGQRQDLPSRTTAVAIVIVSVLLVYAQVYFFEYTNWDDKPFIVDNPHLQSPTLKNLLGLFVPGGVFGELLYLPVTYVSFWIESRVFGLNPHISHSVNLALHLTNAILVLFILNSWLNNRFASLLATLIFAVHPLQVESVAWAMGRKDLISTLFALLTIIFYQKYLSSTSSRYYFPSFLCFICASLAKPSMIVIPALLALVTYLHPKKKGRATLRPLLPLILFGAVVFFINKSIPEPFEPASIHLLGLRLSYFPLVIFGWLKRFLFLEPPEIIYAFSDVNIDEICLLSCIPLLVAIAILIWSVRSRRTEIWFAILFTTFAFLPSWSIIFQNNREFITADRYGYFPMIGVVCLVAIPLSLKVHVFAKWVYQAILCFGIVFSVFASREQVKIWAGSESLWKHVLLHNPEGSPIAATLLGNHFYENNRKTEAIAQFTKAARMKPSHTRAHYNLGRSYSDTGQVDRAMSAYRRALISDPDFLDARFNLGVLLFRNNALDAALSQYSEVIAKDPNHVSAYFSSGLVHIRRGEPGKAIEVFKNALTIDPRHEQARFKLAVTYHKAGNITEALAEYRKLLRTNPGHFKSLYNSGIIYLALGQYENAGTHLNAALRLQPEDPDIHVRLGELYSHSQKLSTAITAYESALAIDPGRIEAHKGLGEILYRLGRNEDASRHLRIVLQEGGTVDKDIILNLVERGTFELPKTP